MNTCLGKMDSNSDKLRVHSKLGCTVFVKWSQESYILHGDAI